MTLRGAALGMCLLAAACGGAQKSQLLHADRDTGVLVPAGEIKGDFVWRQRIHVRYEQRHESFSAVIEKRGDRLLLLGLTPFGTRAFALEQRGSIVTFTPYMDQKLPFSPMYILADVHRTFFRGLPGAPLADGWHEQTQGAERVRERWENGRLFEREYRPVAGAGNAVNIAYTGGMLGNKPPAETKLSSARFGYALTINTLSAQAL